MPPEAAIVTANLALLQQGSALIARLPAAAFAGGDGAVKPVGPHFRHVLEHYSCFLGGIAGGRIDYDAREREASIEVDPHAALERIRALVEGISTLPAGAELDRPAAVRLECGLGDESQQWSQSTARRELHFLLSHTIHHYALIALLLEARGIQPGEDFGVAPSTLKFWNSQASCAQQAG